MKKIKKTLSIFLVVLSAMFSSFSVFANTDSAGDMKSEKKSNLNLRAFVLSMMLFEDSNSSPISVDSPEYNFTKKLLDEVIRKSPALADFLVIPSFQGFRPTSLSPLEGVEAVLTFEERDFLIPVDYASKEFKIYKRIKDQLSQCGFHVDIESVKNIEIEKFEKCSDQLYQDLKKSEIQYFSISVDPLTGNPSAKIQVNIRLSRSPGQYISPLGLIRTLKKQESFAGIVFVSPNPWFLISLGIGSQQQASRGLSVISKNGDIEQMNMLFEYVYGWGDCPSGCRERHKWLVEVNTTQGNFDVKVKESGSILP